MKKLQQKMVCRIALLVVLIAATTFPTFSQTNSEVKSSKFLILVETTSDGLKLSSNEGCAWKELAFTLTTDNSQAIDQYGMTSLINRANPSEDKNLDNFLIIIKKTKNGISLEGKEGTAWVNLSFSCPQGKCYQYIDFKGMTAKQ